MIAGWGYISPIYASASVDGMIDRGQAGDPAFVATLDAIRRFHPSIALVGEGLAAETAPSRGGDRNNLADAEAKYREAAATPGFAQAQALTYLALLYVKHPEFKATAGTPLELLKRA